VIAATLAELPAAVQKAQVHAPTLVIIGHVVELKDRLAWFDR
jgi:uroporphyrin-III C-methyltransferase/precorrin-2 dehydrogenase/sirohydrochlorin ferrochelatase